MLCIYLTLKINETTKLTSPKLQSFLDLYMGINLSLEFVGMGIWLVECWKMGEMMSQFEFHFDFTPP
jgi:hypothetical protein